MKKKFEYLFLILMVVITVASIESVDLAFMDDEDFILNMMIGIYICFILFTLFLYIKNLYKEIENKFVYFFMLLIFPPLTSLLLHSASRWLNFGFGNQTYLEVNLLNCKKDIRYRKFVTIIEVKDSAGKTYDVNWDGSKYLEFPNCEYLKNWVGSKIQIEGKSLYNGVLITKIHTGAPGNSKP